MTRVLRIFLLSFPVFFVSRLNGNEENSQEITGYEEYVLTVASEKVRGLTFSGGEVGLTPFMYI